MFWYCITAAHSRLLASDHDKWLEAPRGTATPSPRHRQKSSPSPPQRLPQAETGQGQMLRILDIRMEKFTVNLDREKKKQYGHILLIILLILFRDLCSYVSIYPTQEDVCVGAMTKRRVLLHKNLCISLATVIIEPSPSPTGGVFWAAEATMAGIAHLSFLHKHAQMQPVSY